MTLTAQRFLGIHESRKADRTAAPCGRSTTEGDFVGRFSLSTLLLMGACAQRHAQPRPQLLTLEPVEEPSGANDLPEDGCAKTLKGDDGNEYTATSTLEFRNVSPDEYDEIITPDRIVQPLMTIEVEAQCSTGVLRRVFIGMTGGDEERTGWLAKAPMLDTGVTYTDPSTGVTVHHSMGPDMETTATYVANTDPPRAEWVVEFAKPIKIPPGKTFRFTLVTTFQGTTSDRPSGFTPSPGDMVQTHLLGRASWYGMDDEKPAPENANFFIEPVDGVRYTYADPVGTE